MDDNRKLSVAVVSGLHSDARREVVEGLLRAVPRSVALHHDLTTADGGRCAARSATPPASGPPAGPPRERLRLLRPA